MDRLLRVAVAGMGGFARSHHAALEALEAREICRVVATCDPNPERFPQREGVEVFPSLDAMLKVAPDVVTLPTPIPLHAEQHAAVVDSGAACYLEKPPSLWWPEYVAMTVRDEAARWATQIGFNFVGDPFRKRLKARIRTGEFGRLERVSFRAVWPRDAAYYARNGWAGRLRADGHPVFDSPLGNAMAHYVQNLLFWGDDPVTRVGGVRAWLARAHPIESYDTAFVSARLGKEVELRIAASHAGIKNFDQETLDLTEARIVFSNWRTVRIEYRDGRTENLESEIADQGAMLRRNFEDYFAYVRGELPGPTTSLSDSESFVRLCALTLTSGSPISGFPEERIRATANGLVEVTGLEDELEAFAEEGVWPHGEPHEATVLR